MQDCSTSSMLAMEILQSCTKPSMSSYLQPLGTVTSVDTVMTKLGYRSNTKWVNSFEAWWHHIVSTFSCHHWINSLAPGRFQRNFRRVIFQLILVIDGWSISSKIVLKWITMDLTEGKSTSVQVMAWSRHATSHYLSQCWPRSLLPYGVIRP